MKIVRGNTKVTGRGRSAIASRKFWAKERVRRFYLNTREEPSGCIVWIGYLDKEGYGKVTWEWRSRKAHRVGFFLKKKRWPKGILCHRCDNPRCVNPDHMFEGTQKDNRVDCARKGRTCRGVDHRLAVLDPDKVREIRAKANSAPQIRASRQ